MMFPYGHNSATVDLAYKVDVMYVSETDGIWEDIYQRSVHFESLRIYM